VRRRRADRAARGAASLELVLPDATRLPLEGELTLGRDPGSTVVLGDPAVSRVHARISPGNGDGPLIEDAGSSHGTFLDGVRLTAPARLRDGARLRLGDSELAVERHRDAAEAGRTIVVPAGASATFPAAGTQVGIRPRLRTGYALKRLEAAEGSRRWVLKDLKSGTYLRLGEDDAALLQRVDGTRSLADLIGEAEQRFGHSGPARLARLLADLGGRGLLAGVEGAGGGPAEATQPWYVRLFAPRSMEVEGAGNAFDALYHRGGRLLYTRPAVAALTLLAAAGVAVFAYLVAGRYGTPFVVASKIGLGGLVFLLGRFAVVAAHEVAHGMTMARFGRHVERAGLKLVLVFPYAFVDTSEAWFEPRRRRIAITAAGPASDLVLGALFAVACLLLSPGTVRDVFFQLAFAAYVGACFNLNPFLDRDGYQLLVDVLREPGLRRRAREQLARRLSGRASSTDSPVLARYSLLALAWSCVAALFAIGMTLRYRPALESVAPAGWIAWATMAVVWAALLAPVALALWPAIAARRA
jgi:putative peptide zinc metalloprotease protein